MKKPAERDCVAVVPGYTGQVAKLYLGRDEEGRLAGVTIFDLLGHVKLQGTAEEAAAWWGVVVAGIRQSQGPAHPAAGAVVPVQTDG